MKHRLTAEWESQTPVVAINFHPPQDEALQEYQGEVNMAVSAVVNDLIDLDATSINIRVESLP